MRNDGAAPARFSDANFTVWRGNPTPAFRVVLANGRWRPGSSKGHLKMHKDQIKGAAKEVAGSVKEAAGKATGNDRLAAKGAAERVAGKVEKGVGGAKDSARSALKK